MPPPEPPPQDFLQILERVWWRLDRALDAASLAAAARDYHGAGAARRRDDARRPSRIAEPDRGFAADPRRSLLATSASGRSSATARASAISAARRRGAGSKRVDASPIRRSCAASSGCTRASPCPTRPSARPGALARELGTVVHVHVAEDRADVDDARRRGFAGPLERLMALEALPAGSILAHGVHLERRSRCGSRPQPAHGSSTTRAPTRATGVGYASALSATKRVALGVDGWEPDMAAEEAALKRLAAENGDAGVDGRLAAGHSLGGGAFWRGGRAALPGIPRRSHGPARRRDCSRRRRRPRGGRERRAQDRRFRADRRASPRGGGAALEAHGGNLKAPEAGCDRARPPPPVSSKPNRLALGDRGARPQTAASFRRTESSTGNPKPGEPPSAAPSPRRRLHPAPCRRRNRIPDQGIVSCFTLFSRKEQGRSVRPPRRFWPGKGRFPNGLRYNR